MPTMEAGSRKISGTLTPLSSLPNPEHQRLFNAENCTISGDGRVFVTGSTAVYEVLLAQGVVDPQERRYEYRAIDITSDEVPKDCFRNGITAFGDYLYLACAHVHQWEKSFFPDWSSSLNVTSQTHLQNVLWLFLQEFMSQVKSYVVRADLRKNPLRFDECFAIPHKCFANGLAADPLGNLYVANSIPLSSCIYKIKNWPIGQDQRPECDVWSKTLTHQLINGLKYKAETKGDSKKAGSIYYTCIRPPALASLEKINVLQNGDASYPEMIHWAIGFFDDFDVAENGTLVIANGSDLANPAADLAAFAHLRMPSGSLIFVSDHELRGVFKDENLFHPSAVKIVDHESRSFAKGDMIVTDKGEDGEYAAFIFTPEDTCRSWFI